MTKQKPKCEASKKLMRELKKAGVSDAELEKLMGVSNPRLRAFRAGEQLPSKFYFVMRDLSAENGVECPEAAFDMVRPK